MIQENMRLHAVIRGKVQGVGFRVTTQWQAKKFQLTGWVKNRADGKVEVLAEGPWLYLEQFLLWLKEGPETARVLEVGYQFSPATNEFHFFEIRE